MKKVTFLWSLFLFFLGAVTAKAQVVPQISTDETVYEYYMTSVSGKQLNVYSDNDNNTPGYDSSSDRARVKIVKAGEDAEGDYYYIYVTNYDGHTTAVGASAATAGTYITYGGTNNTWRKKQKDGDTDAWYFTLVANDNVAFTAYGSKKIGLYNYTGNNVNNQAYRWKFYPANANAMGIDLDITSGYYKIEAIRSGQTGTYLRNNAGNNNVTNRGNGNPLTNNYIWKVDVNDIHLSLLNGQGSPLKVGSTTYPTFDILAKGAEHTYAFSIYLHCNNYSEGIQIYLSAGTDENNQWKFVQVEGTAYEVVFGEDAPEGATITRTTGNVTEKALDGGFFMYAADATPAASDFTVPEVPGKFAEITVDNEAKTITVTYKRPVVPTTIADGQFAEDTQWYVMRINGSKYVTDNAGADRIELTGRSYGQDNEFWCFVANEDGSYKIYNKNAGATHVLASSSDMTLGGASDGAYTYPTLQDEANLPEGYVGSWDFSPSTSIANTKGWYLALHGHSSAVMNDNANRGDLAFWTGGKGSGSTFVITLVEMATTISLETGSFSGTGGYHSTWSSTEFPGLTFSTSANNMMADGDDASLISCFTGSGCTYTLSAPAGYVIKSYSFDYYLRSDNASANVTVNGVAATTTPTTLSATDYNKRTMSFEQGGSNKGVTLSNFNVVIAKQVVPIEESYEVLPAPYENVVHRIPAIAQAKDGTIIAVADYRYSGQDIGMATGAERRLDLNFSLSTDNGKTWNGVHTLIAGQGAPSDNLNVNNLNVAYGDPCIVVDLGTEADPGTGQVLVMSCAGNVSFPNGTADNHQYIVAMRSDDNGANWSGATDVTDQFYDHFNNETHTMAKAMFIGSGKISQSKYIKVGDYYRIYCAVLCNDQNNTKKNYVFYSDDFGTTWNVLGGVNVAPIPSGADEPKADELPDGSVVVSSRISGGRMYNIFQYTDPLNAEGSWGTVATSAASNNGTVAENNSTNGEILTVPVKRKADGKKMFLFLQSVPFGPERANVGIYYKALESLSDFNTPADLAKDWDGRYQACYFSSAYSTMIWLKNNTLGFLYEEDINGSAYSIVYKNYTIEKLTGDAYEYCADVDESVMLKEGMAERMETVESNMGPYVGNLTYGGYMSISNARDAFMATPSKMAYAAFKKAVAEADYRQIEAGREYRINNKPYPAAYLTLQASGLTKAALDENSAAQKLTFHASGTSWKIKGDGAWMCKTNANDACPNVTTDENDENIGLYDVIFDAPGTVYIRCTNPGNANRPYLHLSNGTTLMSWTSAAETSLWRIQPVDSDADELIGNIILDCEHELAMAGKVGYPAASDATVEPFQNAIAAANEALTNSTATTTIYNDLVAKRTAYKSLTDVVMPEDGKAYVFTNIHGKGEQYNAYINYADGTARYVVRGNTAAADLPSSAKFICKVLANGKYAFVNNAGKYLILKGGGSYSNSAKGESSDFADAYNTSGYSDVYVAKESLFGTLKLVFKRDNSHYSPMVHTVSSNGVHSFNQYNDGNQTSTSSSVSGDHSTAFRVEEVPYTSDELPLIPTLNAATIDGENMNISTFSAPFATIIPENAKAFYVSAAGETAMLTRIDGIIPANTGVILTSTTGTANAALLSSSEENMPISGNLLVANPTARNFAGETNTYVLGGKNGVIAFYKATTASTTLGANKAYLEIPGGTAPALLMTFGNGEATGIEGVEGAPAAQEGAIFDLSGRRVLNPTKGLYIIGGKKVYIK